MVFARHGGIDLWRNAKTLFFSIDEEVHTSDLKTRKIIINAPEYTVGFDGKKHGKQKRKMVLLQEIKIFIIICISIFMRCLLF
jgi:hypothetical protein